MTHREPAPELANFGALLAASAKNDGHLDCLEVFAQLLQLDEDDGRPHLMTVLLEPGGEVQVVTIGHAGPGLTIQVNAELELDVPQLWFGDREG